GPTDRAFGSFDESQYGLRLGGPVMKDKLFFFVNGERNRKDQPTSTSANGSAATNYAGVTSPAAVSALLQSRYGYTTGDLGDSAQAIDGDLAFGRLDWNAAQAHQITLRHNYVKANKDIIENRTRTSFRYPNSIYSIADKTNSTVLQINSVLGAYFNE